MRRVGELSKVLARGARAHISWWKASPLPDKRTDQVILEANMEYWDKTRLPRLQRIIFDNTFHYQTLFDF